MLPEIDYVRKAVGSAAVITDHEARVLLVRRNYWPHDWVLPGGVAELDESPMETVIREVREETGLAVRPRSLSGVYYQPDHRAGEFIHFVFRCDVVGSTEVRADAREVAEHAFWPVDGLPEPMSESTRRRVGDAFAGEPPPLPVVLPPRSEPDR